MAIVVDATSSGSTNADTSLTVAHTCTGSELYLLVSVWTNQTSITGVTYNGAAMTSLDSAAAVGGRKIYMWGLANPATGANNIIATASGSGQIYLIGDSYTGCSDAQPDGFSNGTVSNQASIVGTVTVNTDNSWTVMGVVSAIDDNLGAGSEGAGTTLRKQGISNHSVYDSGGALATGAQTLTATLTASQTDDMGQVIVSLAPSGEETETGYSYFM